MQSRLLQAFRHRLNTFFNSLAIDWKNGWKHKKIELDEFGTNQVKASDLKR